jgi:3-methyladenine DNA glycosylase/8-oxoguanine DNA glycosylase
MLASLRETAIAGIEIVDGDRYLRTIDIDGEAGVVAVEPAAGNAVRATIRFAELAALPKIIARVRRLFDLAADPQTINAHLAEDPALAPLVAARPGLRVPGAWDGFETAVRAIADAQTATIVAAVGTRLKSPTVSLSHVFPSPAQVAGGDPAAFGLTKSKARAVHALAAAFAADPQILSARRDIDDAVRVLRAIPDLSETTAHYIAMQELQESDILRDLSQAARAERWRPWRAYAAQHLWAAGMPLALAAE